MQAAAQQRSAIFLNLQKTEFRIIPEQCSLSLQQSSYSLYLLTTTETLTSIELICATFRKTWLAAPSFPWSSSISTHQLPFGLMSNKFALLVTSIGPTNMISESDFPMDSVSVAAPALSECSPMVCLHHSTVQRTFFSRVRLSSTEPEPGNTT